MVFKFTNLLKIPKTTRVVGVEKFMDVAQKEEKMLGIIKDGKEQAIVVTHVTIRQSIFFLVLKLITIEAVAAVGVILFHTLLLSTDITGKIGKEISLFNIPLFVILVFAKTSLVIFVIIQWINEYYEITPKEIIYKRGLIFKKEEDNTLAHLGLVKIEQGIMGKIFNYGTLKLFNWLLDKHITLYLIHNPMKYYHILQTLIPQVNVEKQLLKEHLLEEERI